ncbi:MAG: glutamate racemase [Oscillospiraceae bacterium]
MDNRPIGVFDSGLGGLCAVKQLRTLLPKENIVYLGDTGRIPYGTRSKETINKYAVQDINFLLKHNVKMIIAACGTVSANITEENINSLPVPYTGVLLPLAKRSTEITKNNKIGVIATTASIKSRGFEKTIKTINPSAEVIGVPCPLFVHLVENGLIEDGNKITELTARMYLEPLKKQNPDTLILGCTHFPLIYNAIRKVMGEEVELIDPGQETAKYVKNLLADSDSLGDNENPTIKYFVTDGIDSFNDTANIFLGGDIGGEVSLVRID